VRGAGHCTKRRVNSTSSQFIRCDCHNDVVVAKARDGKLIIRKRQNGRWHVAVLLLDSNGKAMIQS